jgi:hypothetical protein
MVLLLRRLFLGSSSSKAEFDEFVPHCLQVDVFVSPQFKLAAWL